MQNKVIYFFLVILVITGGITIILFNNYLQQKKEIIPIVVESTNIPLIYELNVGDTIINSGEKVGEITGIEYSCNRSSAFIFANVTLEPFGGLFYFYGYEVKGDGRSFSFLHKNGIINGKIIALNATPIFEEKEIFMYISSLKDIPPFFFCDGRIVATVLDKINNSTQNDDNITRIKLNLTIINILNGAYFLNDNYNDSIIQLPYNNILTSFYVDQE